MKDSKVKNGGICPRENKVKQDKDKHAERRKGMKNTEKLPYEEAELEVIWFETNDIITYSGGDILDDDSDIDGDGLV